MNNCTPRIKDIFIIHQKGLEPLGILAKDALNELMNSFPQYKQYFPVANLGNWKTDDPYIWKNGRCELKPYASVDWFLQCGKEQAIRDGRWQTKRQIDLFQTAEGLCNNKSWIILITKEDLYQSPNGATVIATGFFNKVAVISIKHLLNNLNQMDPRVCQTLVQHEFGHILGLTSSQRVNSHMREGPHCLCPNCIMQQQTETNRLENITNNRLLCKAYGLPPICSDCITEGRKRLFKIYAEYMKNYGSQNSGPTGPQGPNGGRN